jgi:predicted nucleic acid-binding protein
MKIYLDVCCLNRPFDNQSDERIHLESEAIISILSYCQSGEWQLIGSSVIDFEISLTPDKERKRNVSILSSIAKEIIDIEAWVIERALELQNFGIKPLDALHISSAEKGGADVFLTTDDKLLKIVNQKNIMLQTRIDNPLKWLLEVIQSGR